MDHGAARIRLERDGLRYPALAEAVQQLAPVAVGGVGEAVQEPMGAFPHGSRAGEARARELDGAKA
jgi:hypothetical protein